MAYSTAADLLFQISDTEIKELALDDSAVDDETQAARTGRAIDDADAEIDGYLGQRFTVPLATVPNLIRKISVDLAIWNLYQRRDKTAPDRRKAAYENALGLLGKIASGQLSIGVSEPAGNGPAASTSVDDLQFTIGKTSDGSTGTLDGF